MGNFVLQTGPCSFQKSHISPWEISFPLLLCSLIPGVLIFFPPAAASKRILFPSSLSPPTRQGGVGAWLWASTAPGSAARGASPSGGRLPGAGVRLSRRARRHAAAGSAACGSRSSSAREQAGPGRRGRSAREQAGPGGAAASAEAGARALCRRRTGGPGVRGGAARMAVAGAGRVGAEAQEPE
jgi:hypothetical protein